MRKLFYPAVFHKADEGGFWITFPDFPECMTQGEDMQESYEMAVDALGLAITCREEEKETLPIATLPDYVVVGPNVFCAIIEFDMLAYK